jgi:hypothetical protein
VDTIDIAKQADRLAKADRIFEYPATPHQRKHGPDGYKDYESYRDWLRDEFSYRCVFSLIRETWIGRKGNFDIDHFTPQAIAPSLVCDYDNLLYLRHSLNLSKSQKRLPDPCDVALGECLRVEHKGENIGEIYALNKKGETMIDVLLLDDEGLTRERKNWIRILRSVATTDENLFFELIGYPKDLPNLRDTKPPQGNKRPDGLSQSAFALREKNHLPEWYC